MWIFDQRKFSLIAKHNDDKYGLKTKNYNQNIHQYEYPFSWSNSNIEQPA